MASRGKPASSNQHKGKGGRFHKPLSRKERRKQERTAKKQRKAAQYLKKKVPVQPASPLPSKTDRKPLKGPAIKSSHDKQESGLARLQRKRALEDSSTRDDVEISRLEKLLKIKRRKKLPSSFREEGLDYILDLTDKSGKFDWGAVSSDSEQSDHDSEPEEVSHKKHGSKAAHQKLLQETVVAAEKHSAKTVRFSLPSMSDEGEEVWSDCAKGAESDSDGYVESSDGDCEEDGETEDVDLGEDDDLCEGSVSGDSCDDGEGSNSCDDGDGGEGSDSCDDGDGGEGRDSCDDGDGGEGSDSCDGGGTKYIPPHLRAKMMGGEKERENNARLQRQVQGLVNRLSESNLRSISTQLEQLYQQHSRNDMNSALCGVLLKLCATAARLTDRFAMEHALLVALLHSHVGQEVGAFVVQGLAQRLDALLKDSPHTHSTKECSCVLMIIAFLYCYRVIHCSLVYDIIRQLLETLTERNIELLLILLKHTGMEIRKDDASSLKDIILLIQQKAASAESALAQSSRSKFMLDTIAALKTNNARKIPNYDPSLLEHMKRLLRGSLRSNGPLDEGQLKISLNDLLNADTHGKWWIVGSAWSGRDPAPQSAPPPETNTKTWVLELARKQRMTTDVRKTIFSVVMTAEDYADAFEKLVKLGLKEVQEREMVHVLVDCCLQENSYNPYYAFLGQKLCEFKRGHQVTFQYSLWDRFKVLESLSKLNRANLVKLLSHLIYTKAISIAVLRVVEFADLSPTGVKFFKSLLTHLLCDHPEDTVLAMFTRVTPLPHLKAFRDKLLVFMKHYLIRDKSSELLKERFQTVEKSMRTNSHLF